MVELRTKFVYATISLLITLQFGLKDYIFTLDWIPVLSHVEVLKLIYGFKPPVYGGSLPLTLLEILIPAWLFQRLVIFSVLFLSGISADVLAGKFVDSTLPRLYAGILYMINPFTYVRLLVGHWILLFSYAFLPLGIYTFLRVLEEGKVERCIEFALVETVIGFSAHMLLISFVVYLILLLAIHEFSIKLIKKLVLSSVFFLVLSSYWILPLIAHRGSTVISFITVKDLNVFAPKGSMFELLAMYGFWKQGYLYAKDFLGVWWEILFLIIFGSVMLGYFSDKRKSLPFLVILLVGFALASGIRGPLSPILTPLFEHTLLKGMRDSQKFVAMLVISYSVMGAVALDKLKKKYVWIVLVMLFVPFIYSFTFFNCFAGQVHPCDYPGDWYKVKSFLDEDKDNFRVLFLPWHLYMTFYWVKDKNKLIANPAPLFFDRDVIAAKNIEIPGVYTEIYTPYQVYVMDLLKNKTKIHDFGEKVAVMGVKYILLTKEVDYKKYFFLFNQSDLKPVMETENFYVFKNLDFHGLAYTINSNISRVQTTVVNPAKVLVRTQQGTLIFTWQYSPYWSLNGEKPSRFLAVCKFEVKGFYRGYIVYSRFFVALVSYLVSLVSLFLVTFYYAYRRLKFSS